MAETHKAALLVRASYRGVLNQLAYIGRGCITSAASPARCAFHGQPLRTMRLRFVVSTNRRQFALRISASLRRRSERSVAQSVGCAELAPKFGRLGALPKQWSTPSSTLKRSQKKGTKRAHSSATAVACSARQIVGLADHCPDQRGSYNAAFR